MPQKASGLGLEAGGQTYNFTYEYSGSTSGENESSKELTGSVVYFNGVYSVDLSNAVKFFAKAGFNYSSSDLTVSIPGLADGTGSGTTAVGFGYGFGIMIAPPNSFTGFLAKFDNFGTVVEDYENDLIAWTSDNKFLRALTIDT